MRRKRLSDLKSARCGGWLSAALFVLGVRPVETFGQGPTDQIPPHFSTEDRIAVKKFEALYALPEGEIIRRVKRPFDESRLVYYRYVNEHQAELIPEGPDAMLFPWKEGKLGFPGMTFNVFGGYDIPDLLESRDIYPQDIEIESKLRRRVFKGDYVIREGVPLGAFLKRLQEVLSEDVPGLKMEFREVERDVYVARGKYELKPLPTSDKAHPQIEIYGAELNKDPHSGGGGTGKFDHFFKWTGRWISRPIVNEVENPPATEVSWHLNDSPPSREAKKASHDPELVLKNMTAQTGMTFTPEKRKMRVLFVEAHQ